MEILYAFLILAGVVFAIVVLVAVRLILREPRHKAAWAPITNLINGVYSGTMGALHYRYKVTGVYQDIPVEAFIDAYSAEDVQDFFNYHLRINCVSMGRDWVLRFTPSNNADQGRDWYFESKDEALAQRLNDAATIEFKENDPRGSMVKYEAAALEYEKSVDTDNSVPTPSEFELQFKLLTDLAELNSRVNTN
jgi:hypothetical protein